MKKILISILTVTLFASCDSYLDTVPDNRMDIDNADKISKMLVSAYSVNSPVMIAELSSDNVRDNGAQYDIYGQNTKDAYLWNDQTTEEADAVKNLWQGHYSAITSANQALEAIEKQGNPKSLNPQRGEALLCRAYAHFCLVNIFCQAYSPATAEQQLGVPYMRRTMNEINPNDQRGTLAQTYACIEQDIKEGLPLIDDQAYTVPKYHFNKKAAYAFAARFYLYAQQWKKTIQYANLVLGDEPASKLRPWKQFSQLDTDWDARTNAYISAKEECNLMLQTAISSWPYICGPYNIGRRYGCAQSVITKEILPGPWGSYAQLYMGNGIWGYEQKYVLPKFNGYFEYFDKTSGIGYLHLVNVAFSTDELLVDRAEAYVMDNQPDKAAADLCCIMKALAGVKGTREKIVAYYNACTYMRVPLRSEDDRTIKKKLNPRGFSLPDYDDAEPLIQCALHMRRVLSVHEGLRWYDVKRWGIEIGHVRSGNTEDVLKVDDPRRAIQLPQEVIAAGLEANPRN